MILLVKQKTTCSKHLSAALTVLIGSETVLICYVSVLLGSLAVLICAVTVLIGCLTV